MKLPCYFRCTDSAKRCPLYLSGEVHPRTAEFQCPACDVRCDEFRESVPLTEALWSFPKVRLAVFGMGVLVLLALAWSWLASGDADLTRITADEQRLESFNGRISKLPMPRGNASAESAAKRVQAAELEQRIRDLTDQVSLALSNQDGSVVERLKQAETAFRAEVARLTEERAGPSSGVGEAMVKGKLLREEVTSFEKEVEDFRETLLARRPDLAERTGELMLGIQSALARLKPLIAPTTPTSIPLDMEDSLVLLNEAQQALASYVPPPPPIKMPFDRSETTLRIVANPTIARSMVEPLIAAWVGGNWVGESTGERFLLSDAKNYKIILTLTSEPQISAEIAESRADVAFTTTATDGLTRADAEVIALDALCLFSHPTANLPPFQPGQSAKPLMAGNIKGDLGLKAEEFGLNLLDARTQRTPLEAVLEDEDALALAFYHEEKNALPRAARMAVQPQGAAFALLPSPFSIATEDYAFAFRVIMRIGHGHGRAQAQDLARYAISDAGQNVISEQGYVDLRLRPAEVDVPADIQVLLASALGVDSIKRARRLNTNFRFEFGEAVLDLKAKADIERLPPMLAANHAGDKVVILGFTDNKGGADVNDRLSRQRAGQVASDLKRFKVAAVAEGLGPRFPVDDNGTDAGRARNRRAEVWIVTP